MSCKIKQHICRACSMHRNHCFFLIKYTKFWRPYCYHQCHTWLANSDIVQSKWKQKNKQKKKTNTVTIILWIIMYVVIYLKITCSSSSGVKSFLMLNVFLISSGVLPVWNFRTMLSKIENGLNPRVWLSGWKEAWEGPLVVTDI